MAAWVGKMGDVHVTRGITDDPSGLRRQGTLGLGSGPCCAWGPGWRKLG